MYKAINGWTKRKIINHIKKNFKGKSMDNRGNCLYRGPKGKKCALGLFIPDDLYNKNMEFGGIDIVNLRKFFPLGVEGCYELQNVHDCSEPKNTLSGMIAWIKRGVK